MVRSRTHGAGAWWAGALVLAGATSAAAALVAGSARVGPPPDRFDLLSAFELTAFVVYVLLGALLVLRRPHHPIGWLLAGLGLVVLVQQATQEYALLGSSGSGGHPAWRTAWWISEWTITAPLVLFVVILLLFPTGRPTTARWRAVTWSVASYGALLTIGRAVAAWPPRHIASTGTATESPAALAPLQLVLVACVPVAVASLVLRYRDAGRDERRQLRWLLLGALCLTAAVVAGLTTTALGVTSRAADAAGTIGIVGVAAGIALAVLRYRLYDIDRILSRTVSYAALTTLLAVVYVAAVLVFSGLLGPLLPDSGLDVAASTMVVAAAFSPLRARVHGAVARRFNRARYDAELIVAALRDRVRDDVRLDALRVVVLDSVAATVQPTQVSLWLTDASGSAPPGIGPSTGTRGRTET